MLNISKIVIGESANSERYPNDPVMTIRKEFSSNQNIHLNYKAREALKLGWGIDSINQIAIVKGYNSDENLIVIAKTDVDKIEKTKYYGTYRTATVHQFSGNFRSSTMLNILETEFELDPVNVPEEGYEFALIPLEDEPEVFTLKLIGKTVEQMEKEVNDSPVSLYDSNGSMLGKSSNDDTITANEDVFTSAVNL